MTLYSIKMSNNRELIVDADDSTQAYEFALRKYQGHSVVSLAMVPTVSATQEDESEDPEED